MCFTNCVTQTTTTIFRENSTKILGCKDAGIVYKTHIYVHSNFLSCKMSLVFVLLSLLNFRGEMCVYILLSPFFLVFRNFLLQQTNIKIICRLEERLWGPQEDFEHSWFKYSFLPIISIIRTFSYGKYCVSSDVVVNISYAS